MDKFTVFAHIDNLEQEMVQTLMALISVPAIAPENGGDGEEQKAQRLIQFLEETGFDRVERYDAADLRVSSGKRPNVIAYLYDASNQRRLWIVTHLDVVPSGREEAWTESRPFRPVLSGDCVFGRVVKIMDNLWLRLFLL